MKRVMIITMLVLMSISTIAYTDIDWSIDNSTWQDLTETNNNTETFETLGDGIASCTTYYFRMRSVYSTQASDWAYKSQKTLCEVNNVGLSIAIGLILLIGGIYLFLYRNGTKFKKLIAGILVTAVGIMALYWLTELPLAGLVLIALGIIVTIMAMF